MPPSPTGDVKPQRQTYRTQYEWYAQENGISVEEAKRRTSEQIQVQSIFKRDPEATLGKYSVHPRFRAAKAAYTEAELRALAEPWVERFTEAGIMGGYSVDGTRGTVEAACGDGQVVNVGNPESEARFTARYPGN